MKELTIKKETLDVIRQMVADGQVSQEVAEKYFPELRESESEKIRKDIIKMVTNTCKGEWFIDSSKEECLSWLEKQGEQKPILNVPTRDVILSIWDLGNEWKELTNGCISTEYGTQLDYIQKHWHESEYYLKEKQGEQKPKDRYTFNSIPRLLDMIEPTDRAKSYCQKLIDSLSQEGYTTDAKIVSNCLKRMNGEKVAMATMDEQKPAWSEEDEKMLADACIMLDWYQGNNWWKAQHIKNWLKSLKQRIKE